MKTTVDLPDDLARRIKAEKRRPPTAYELMKDGRGIVDSGTGDLATNPKHMKGFGRASRRHR